MNNSILSPDSPTTACAWPRMNLAPKASDRVTSLPVCVNEKSNKPTDTLQGCSLTQGEILLFVD